MIAHFINSTLPLELAFDQLAADGEENQDTASDVGSWVDEGRLVQIEQFFALQLAANRDRAALRTYRLAGVISFAI